MSSNNPFRRSQALRVAGEIRQNDEDGDTRPSDRTRTKKRVIIQTPPHSPELADKPRLLTTDGTTGSPPPSRQTLEDGDSALIAVADSPSEHAVASGSRIGVTAAPNPHLPILQSSAARAPYNPFEKTLATSEAALGLSSVDKGHKGVTRDGYGHVRPSNSRPALDVDQFKNILMTGQSPPSPPVTHSLPRTQDSSSSTDTSSISRQSIFDNMSLEAHPESPRTSTEYEHHPSEDESGDDDNEHSSLMGPVELRPVAEPPPRPPKHARSFPQTVSFADFDESIPSGFTMPPKTSQINTHITGILRSSTPQSPSDLNKPLPPPPADAARNESHAPKVPEKDLITSPNDQRQITDSTAVVQSKKAPPPPPASRRAVQSVAGQARPRSTSNLTQESAREFEHDKGSSHPADIIKRAAPPPPPPSSRKAQLSSATEDSTSAPTPNISSNDSKASIPPPPPRRLTSSRNGSSVEALSNSSSSIVSLPESESSQSTTTNVNAPPVPPPRRAGGSKRSSLDGPPISLYTRGLDSRRTSGQSIGSDQPAFALRLQQVAEPEEGTAVMSAVSDGPTKDVLADMTAFQAEIDALRARAAETG